MGLGGARAAEDGHRPVVLCRGSRRPPRRRRQRARLSGHVSPEHCARDGRLQRAAQVALVGQRARPGDGEVLRADRAEHRAPRESAGYLSRTNH